jgi:hypothetical protein
MENIVAILITLVVGTFAISTFILSQYKEEIYEKIERSNTE